MLDASGWTTSSSQFHLHYGPHFVLDGNIGDVNRIFHSDVHHLFHWVQINFGQPLAVS